ncbi:SurA N-terminal domain-containing protein [Haemophilus influenzae]|uniref:Periplasmic chaperone PpiD n=1 Tax=Haemophilus influenzae (strain PittGG) TaxID=374931 RepID=A5UID6_HAEIG|nr:SurA N-terminal domain-containing protein [Haemophilus influenzae]ABR00542.1 peptidyl-prolyl cis-trans isomerase D [Haemophilus influenzae PittGG]MCK8788641.1 SurA N-terminal domain-containing protein [Haemophilus influenzae]MCK8863474.1 SurA N-terminal domain-containing protein [Haemophilus influenzae]MDO7264394.1 SurA N-terminal domain-containing protein [Haemophilus influenzae]QFG56167.1 peptidylprolyl isomerase [Haemophilus influenzae]
MLIEKMHNLTNSKISKFILGLIAVSFLVGGMSGYLFSSNDTYAAKVNGEVISQQDFLNRYNQEFEIRAQREGEAFVAQSDSPEFVTALRQNIVNLMIDQELLRQYVKELKLGVSDEMIKRAIVTDPNFQVKGKFDNAVYQRILQQNHLTSDGYASILRASLPLEQIQNGVANSEFIVPAQVKNSAEIFFQKRLARLATLSLADEMAKQSVSDDEIKTYYEANQKSFVQPEQVKVQYIDLSADNISRNLQVTDVEIAQYYQDNKAQFMTQHLAHIQFANEQDAKVAYEELQKGANFADVAKAKSLDKISGENGGDLGWVNENELPKAFEDAAAALQVGQYSQPINVDGNYHIVLVQERKAQSLENVKAQIADLVRKSLMESRYFSLEKQASDKAFEDSKSLNTAAQAAGVKVQESDYFSRQNVPAGLNFPNVIYTIFESDTTNVGMNSEPINVGDYHTIIVRVLDRKAEGVKSLEEAKIDIETFLKRQKAENVLNEKAQQAVKKLSENPESKIDGINFSSEQTFTLSENKDPILTNGIFSIAKPKSNEALYQVVHNSNGDVVVVALNKVEQSSLSEKELSQFGMQLLRSHQSELQVQLIQGLRERAKIEVNDSFINQDDEVQQ